MSGEWQVRIWKARASDKLGKANARERQKSEYSEKLKKRFSETKEIRRIANHRHLPRVLMKQKRQRQEDLKRQTAKLKRIKAHSRADTKEPEGERTKQIVNILE